MSELSDISTESVATTRSPTDNTMIHGVTMTNSERQPGKNRNTGPSNPPAEPEADYEETSRPKGKTRVSTSTKLPGTDRVTPPLVTPLVDNRASIEEALNSIVEA